MVSDMQSDDNDVAYRAAGVVDYVACDGDAEQLPFSVLDVVAQVDVRRSVDHVHLHTHTHTQTDTFVGLLHSIVLTLLKWTGLVDRRSTDVQ